MNDMKDKPQVIVSETGEGRFIQKINIGNFVLTADEPSTNGGNDKGPSPYDFLLTSLGACTSMTIRLYAEWKKIPLEHITVALRHNKVYAEDCKNCENEKSKIDKIDVAITLQGALSQDQRAKLLEIANKCPVHRTLTSTIKIETTLN